MKALEVGHKELEKTYLAARHAEALEGLRARHLVNKVAVDIKQGRAVFGLVHQMCVPNFVVERFAGHESSPVSDVMNAEFGARIRRAGTS